jgi:soluble cytochrome b562
MTPNQVLVMIRRALTFYQDERIKSAQKLIGVDGQEQLELTTEEDGKLQTWILDAESILTAEYNQKSLSEMAKQVYQVAKDWQREGDSADEDMQGAYDSDAKDLNGIGLLIQTGKLDEARQKVRNLDTIVRDQVPDDVWDFLFPD